MPVKIEKDNSITISGFEGIGSSVLSDFSDMMGVNTEIPGVVGANFKFNKIQESLTPQTVTFNDATGRITSSGSVYYRGGNSGVAVVFSTTGALPTGITAGKIYYISSINLTSNQFNVYDTLKGAVDGTAYTAFSGSGTGTHTMTFITPKHISGWTKNSQGRVFALDTDQRVWFCGSEFSMEDDPWYLIAGNTGEGNGDGNGIIYYKGYVLVWTAGAVDALLDIQSASDTVTWTKAFDDINISNLMSPGQGYYGAVPFLSVNEDAIFFYNGLVTGRYYQIGMLEEVAGQTFNPASGATFDFVESVFTIPFENNGHVTTINEIGEYLIVGTWSNKIYFWDKKSPSFTTYSKLQEQNIRKIEVIDNLAYIFMAYSGNIYIANTISVTPLLKLPEHLSGEYYRFINGVKIFKVNDAVVNERDLLFSISIVKSDGAYNYLMSYNLDSKQLLKKNISYFGEINERSGNTFGYIYSILPLGKNIIISSSDYDQANDVITYAAESLLYVAQYSSGSESYYVYDGNEPYIITGLIGVGDVYNKKTLRELQISLARALATGQGVTVSYRRDDNSAWTTLKTIDYATNGAIKDIKIEAPITDIIDLQIKINLDGLNLTSPLLKFVRLIP